MLKKDPNLTIEDANAILEIQKQLTGPLTTSSFIIIFNLPNVFFEYESPFILWVIDLN